jgi:hypothetical protein
MAQINTTVTGHWLLASGCWLLDFGNWLFQTKNLILVTSKLRHHNIKPVIATRLYQRQETSDP